MSESPLAIARFMLDRAVADGVADMTPMKLLKLAYVAHGWHLCFTDQPLLSEAVEAWKYGPVVPSLYHYFKRFGASPVAASEANALPTITSDRTKDAILEGVWGSYKRFSGLALSSMTHQPDTPWYETWHHRGGMALRCTTIDNLLIRDYFRNLLNTSGSASGPVVSHP